ncbi:MAG: exopolyphosphatase [Clostridia bacterium]|nr:exopolyphosphatase [Clostridia bacterium]
MTNIAVIDLGSNSVRVSVAKKESGEVVYIGKNPIMLSQGMNHDMLLKEEPKKRCKEAFLQIKEISKRFEVKEIYAFATAAVRKAYNQKEFLDFIKQETGIEIFVLTGEEEAELDCIGVLDKTGIKDALILDTGGGSTEFIGVKAGKIVGAVSVPIGSRSIKELFFGGGETPCGIEKAKEEIEKIIDGIPWLESLYGFSVIGIGGSNRTVGKIYLESIGPDFLIDKLIMDYDEVVEIISRIEVAPAEERLKINGITPDRADIILGGVLPLKVLMTKLKSPMLYITDAGLRDGIIKKIRENPKEMEKYKTVLE